MNRADTRQAYDARSTKLSDVTRQLNFAGIAVVWIFQKEGANTSRLPHALAVAALWFVASLACDLAHYAYASAAWGIFNRVKEIKKVLPDEDFQAPPAINWVSLVFFWGKVGLCVVGLHHLAGFLLDRVVVG